MVETVSPPARRGLLSVVVPVYGCESCLATLCQRVDRTLAAAGWDYELILVDDRSPDNSWRAIQQLQQEFGKVKGVRLSRNFGQHVAITAGLAQSRGDRAVVMDCDLQDPPELIPQLMARMDEGCDIVFARRIERGHSLFRVLSSRAYFRILSWLTDTRIDGSYGAFSALSRKVIDSFLLFGEPHRHYLLVLRWLGFQSGDIEYEQPSRFAGRSSYSLRMLFRHAVSGLFFHATVLLRWIVSLGLICAFLGVVAACYVVYRYLSQGALPGWTSVIVLILLSTGAILTSLGVIGQYIGTIFDQTKGRPLYVIDVISDRSPR